MSVVEIINWNKHFFVDDELYFKYIPSDINGIIVMNLIYSANKICYIEDIDKILCENTMQLYNLINNADFWQFLSLKGD